MNLGAARQLCCSNCRQPMRLLALEGHYGRGVEIDLCDRCCLIWFDTVECARLAGPGVAALIEVIHDAMRGEPHPHAMTLASGQRCAVCEAGLDTVFNFSRFGRTAQMQCPNGHGYYQTYMLYLAEKGFVRPMTWADVSAARGRQVFCANCGAGLPERPHDACPYCQSAVGVLDPARLATSTALGREAPAIAPDRRDQPHCHACGGAVDPTRDAACPHCQAFIKRTDTAAALAAIEAIRNARSVREAEPARLPRTPVERERDGWLKRLLDKDNAGSSVQGERAVAAVAVLFMLYLWLR